MKYTEKKPKYLYSLNGLTTISCVANINSWTYNLEYTNKLYNTTKYKPAIGSRKRWKHKVECDTINLPLTGYTIDDQIIESLGVYCTFNGY